MINLPRHKTISIKGFRSIKEVELEFRPLNVLISANRAGKSNLIAFFKLMNELMAGRLQQHLGVTGRATANLAAVVGVNRCGSEPGLAFDGRSSAFDHMGIQLFEASSEEQVLTTTIDIEALRTWREKFPALRDIVI